MGFVPGADGDKSVFKDGIQVDHVSENTVGHGARVRGISDPTTYPVISGDIGEKFESAWAGTLAAATSSYVDLGNQQTFGAGRWLIIANGAISSPATQTFSNQWDFGLVIDGVSGTEYGKTTGAGGLPVANYTGYGVSLSLVIDKTSSWTLKARARAYYGGTGTPTYYGAWTAVRIA